MAVVEGEQGQGLSVTLSHSDEPPLLGWWVITGFAKLCLAAPLLPLGFLCVRDPRYTDFRSKESPSSP